MLTPVAGRPDLQIPALIGLALLVLLATVTVRRRQVYWDLYRKLGVLMALFVVFQSPVLVFHPQELSATGFYYGAIFSVLFAPLVASVFADMGEPRRALATTTARLGLLWVLVISAVNFQAINDSWTAHSNAKALDYLPELPIYGHGADVGALARHAAWYRHRNGQLPADAIEASYSPDVTTGLSHLGPIRSPSGGTGVEATPTSLRDDRSRFARSGSRSNWTGRWARPLEPQLRDIDDLGQTVWHVSSPCDEPSDLRRRRRRLLNREARLREVFALVRRWLTGHD